MTAADVSPGTASLSPSRAADFLSCPLRYRFRVIDRLPERATPAATRGTLVHAVLERLFDLPAAERTVERATALLEPEWQRLLAEEPALADLFPATAGGRTGPADPAPPDAESWLRGAADLLSTYFALEDPRRLEPAQRELRVETVLETELGTDLVLRGYVDRLDVAPSGEMRVLDYKTSRAPSEWFAARAMFQMRFYALVLWRLHGRVPRRLELLYLGSGDVLWYEPDEADLRATERKVRAVWRAIERATATGNWQPSPSRLCDWCDHKMTLCPAWGGTLPPLPEASTSDGRAGDYPPVEGGTGPFRG